VVPGVEVPLPWTVVFPDGCLLQPARAIAETKMSAPRETFVVVFMEGTMDSNIALRLHSTGGYRSFCCHYFFGTGPAAGAPTVAVAFSGSSAAYSK
jgi:hypothetical protein